MSEVIKLKKERKKLPLTSPCDLFFPLRTRFIKNHFFSDLLSETKMLVNYNLFSLGIFSLKLKRKCILKIATLLNYYFIHLFFKRVFMEWKVTHKFTLIIFHSKKKCFFCDMGMNTNHFPGQSLPSMLCLNVLDGHLMH